MLCVLIQTVAAVQLSIEGLVEGGSWPSVSQLLATECTRNPAVHPDNAAVLPAELDQVQCAGWYLEPD